MGVLFASCAAAVVAVLAAVLFVRRQYAYWERRRIPFAPPSLPFGNYADSMLQRRSFSENIRDLYASTVAPVIGTWFMLRPMLLLNDPALIRAVCIKDFANFADRGVFSDPERCPLSGNLFALQGERWHQLRTKLSPAFTSGKLKAMFGTLVASGEPLRRHIDAAAADWAVVEMRELLAQYTTNVIASVAFGLDIDCLAEPETAFRRIGRKVFEPTAWNSVRGLVSGLFPRFWSLLRLKSVDADVEEFFMSVVRQNMEHRETSGVLRKDFFQLLLQLRNGGVQADGVWELNAGGGQQQQQQQEKLLSLGECAAQSFLFFVAGFETTSSTVSFTLYELAKNVECQRRVQREIDEVLARHGGQVTYDSVSELKYLDWCFNETLRKYPPVSVIIRTAANDWRIPNTSWTVESGTVIMIPVHALHMDARYYAEPERFRPERFDPSGVDYDAQRPYLPFGEGPRNCIGMRLAQMQSKVGLVCMLREHSYELAHNTTRPLVMNPSSFLLAPVGGVNLRISRRERN